MGPMGWAGMMSVALALLDCQYIGRETWVHAGIFDRSSRPRTCLRRVRTVDLRKRRETYLKALGLPGIRLGAFALFLCAWLVIGMASKSPLRGLFGGLLLGLLGWGLLAWNARSTEGDVLSSGQQETAPPALELGKGSPLWHLGKGIIPVWARQTSAARQQTEESINGLTSQFASMQQELHQAAGAAGMERIDPGRPGAPCRA